jgi:hypothetical protein
LDGLSSSRRDKLLSTLAFTGGSLCKGKAPAAKAKKEKIKSAVVQTKAGLGYVFIGKF